VNDASGGGEAAPLLKVCRLSKRFGGLQAFSGLDIAIAAGEIVGLIGPNGSGKTTFFNVLTGLYAASEGQILFGPQRRDITRLPAHRITALGIARTFQNQRCFNQMTVLENVLVGMHCRTRNGVLGIVFGLPRARREQRRAIEAAKAHLAFFGERLLPRQDKPAGTLSYANRRRLEIARALASEPRLLLLDEPAAGMNPTETRELMSDIRRMRERGVTVMVIEHDLSLVREVCQRVMALDHGQKIAEGTFEEVRNHPRVLEAYLGRRAAHA
jgi:ABC-type branched-subunit amino acid transport system ATPase component